MKLTDTLLKIIWPKYMQVERELSFYRIMKCWIVQKIFRINSQVPWPVHYTTIVMAPEKIVRGTRTPGFAPSCFLDGRNGIKFGKNVWVGPKVSIISMDHDVNDYHNYSIDRPIIIGDNCWIAANVVILPGIEIGEHTIIAAGAIVTKSFLEGNQIIGGNPARRLKALSSYKNT